MDKVVNDYSLSDYVRLAFYVIKSKLINRKIRLIRFPVDIRGRKYIDFGHALTTGRRCRFDVFGKNAKIKKLVFGKNVQLNDSVHIVCMKSVKIGNNVLMASNIFISDCSHGSYKGDDNDTSPLLPPTERPYAISPVVIEDNVWIGEGVCIMPGVSIGEGCVIGAHSVVSKSIPSYSIAVGAPARVIKKYDFNTKHWEKA